MKRTALLSMGLLFLVGCSGSSNGTPPHNAEEEKAVREAASLTPQQQLERAEKNDMLPPDQKAALIRSIKEKNGL